MSVGRSEAKPFDAAARAALRAAERERGDEPVAVTLPRLIWQQWLRGQGGPWPVTEMEKAVKEALDG